MDKKKEYKAPTLEVVLVELEQGIAASSATVNPDATVTVTDITDDDPTNTQQGDF